MSKMKKDNLKIAVVVVTFNRKELLKECLQVLLSQTRPLDEIIVIDNASRDGTDQMIRNEFPQMTYVRLPENIGGAGGFHEGMKLAYKKGYDWIWVMDDDIKPKVDALEQLINKIKLVSEKANLSIGFVCSKVLWKDGSVHKMNVPQIQPLINCLPFNTFEEFGLLLVRACSFVSVLINREAIRKVGLPIREFFIWADDIEYTDRITNIGYFGLYVKDSIVYHKTNNNYHVNILTDSEKNAWKYFYGIRNNLYIIRKQSIIRFILNFFKSLISTNLKIILHRKTGRLKFV